MSRLSSIAVKSGVLTAGRVVSGLSTVLISVILTRTLSEHDFSTFSQCLFTYRFAVPFLSLGLPSVMLFMLPMAPDRQRGVLTESLFLLMAAGAGFSLFLFLGGDRLFARQFNNPDLSQALKWFALYPVFFLPLVCFGACLTACDRVSRFFVFNAIFRIITVLSVGVGALIVSTPEAALLALTVAAGINFLPGLYLMYNACGNSDFKPRMNSLRQQIKLAIPTMGAGVIGRIQLELDRFFIASYCSIGAFAQYTIASQNLFFVPVLIGSVSSVLRVEMTTLFNNRDARGAKELWQSTFLASASVVFPIVLFCLFSARDLVVFLFTETYAESAVAFRILLVIPFLRCANFTSVPLAAGKPATVTMVLLFTVTGGVVLNWILVPSFATVGAAVATALTAYLIETPLHVICIRKQLGLDLLSGFRVRLLGRILFAAALPGGVFLLSPFLAVPPIFRLLIFGLLYISILPFSYHYLGVGQIVDVPVVNQIRMKFARSHG